MGILVKIVKGSELYDKLEKLQEKIDYCFDERDKFLKKYNIIEYAKAYGVLQGGLSVVRFKEQPAGWKKIGKPGENLYMPKDNNKLILAEIKKLPTLSYSALNSIIKYRIQEFAKDSGTGYVIYFCPSFQFKKKSGYALLEFADQVKYKLIDGMEEITFSEFEKLSKKK